MYAFNVVIIMGAFSLLKLLKRMCVCVCVRDEGGEGESHYDDEVIGDVANITNVGGSICQLLHE